MSESWGLGELDEQAVHENCRAAHHLRIKLAELPVVAELALIELKAASVLIFREPS